MSDGTRPRLAENGLPRQGTQVQMSPPWNPIVPTICEANDPIYTQDMGSCDSFATFDHMTCKRTLTHLPGGATTDSFFESLAAAIDPNNDTTLITIGGGDNGEVSARETQKRCQDGLEAAMKVKYPETPYWRFDYLFFMTNAPGDGQIKGSFVLQADGQYGIGLT